MVSTRALLTGGVCVSTMLPRPSELNRITGSSFCLSVVLNFFTTLKHEYSLITTGAHYTE